MVAGTWVSEGTESRVPTRLELKLLRGFELCCDGVRTDLPVNVQRLLAFLAVRGRAQHRHTVAGTLWIDSPEDRAAASLRTALWRARRVDQGLITASGGYLSIGSDVRIDLSGAAVRARELASDPPTSVEGVTAPVDFSVEDLLPEWYDDWVLLERERLRQIHLHSLEAVARQLSEAGRHALAVEAGLAAVAAEPLRESAQRVLITVYLAEGNMSEAVRQYDAFAALLYDALGIAPSEATRQLVAPCR